MFKMTKNELVNNNEWVIIKNNKAVTTSLKISEVFRKRHDNVMHSIEGLLKNKDTHKMFAKSTYIHNQNKQEYPLYYMNRDGFTLLAMGFTGKEAVEFKIKLIEEFNRMEEYIKETNDTGMALFIPDNHKNDPMIQQNMILSQMMNQLTTQRMEFLDFQEKTSKELSEMKELQDFKVDVSTQSALSLEIKAISRATGLSEREVRNRIYDKIAKISGRNIHKHVDLLRDKLQQERIKKVGEPYKDSTLSSKVPIYLAVQDLGLNDTMKEVVYEMKTNYKQYKL